MSTRNRYPPTRLFRNPLGGLAFDTEKTLGAANNGRCVKAEEYQDWRLMVRCPKTYQMLLAWRKLDAQRQLYKESWANFCQCTYYAWALNGVLWHLAEYERLRRVAYRLEGQPRWE